MEKEIKIKPIGIIHTPYKEPKGIPIQGTFLKGIRQLTWKNVQTFSTSLHHVCSDQLLLLLIESKPVLQYTAGINQYQPIA